MEVTDDESPLIKLPSLVLELIAARYLSAKDLVSLSNSCTNFHYLRKYLPEYLYLTGENFNLRGPDDGHFCPELYFEGPVMDQRMRSVSLEWAWRDQGHGNRKGMLWVQLVRGEEVMADSLEDYPNLAPHVNGGAGPVGRMERHEMKIRDHPVVNLSRPGDRLRFMRNVGGGGGHRLKVNNFKAKIELKKF